MRKKGLLVFIFLLLLGTLVACKPTEGGSKPSEPTSSQPEPSKSNGGSVDEEGNVYYKLTLPEGITSDQEDDSRILKDTSVRLFITVPENHILKTLMIGNIDYADDTSIVGDNYEYVFTIKSNVTVTFTTEDTTAEPITYEYEIKLPSLWLLPDAEETDIQVVEDAPDLLIMGIVLDTYKFFNYETMSAFEYMKVFNNTTEPYNLKGHRIVLANPMQGQNWEDEDSQIGNASLVTGHLFNSYIDEDFFIEPLSTALLWLKPYYWTAGPGGNGPTGTFSTLLTHDQAAQQTVEDFKEFWHLDEDHPVLKVNNQPWVAIHPNHQGAGLYPLYGPGGGQGFTHLNSVLLRGLEIQKFDDQGGTAEAKLLNNTNDIPEETLNDEDALYEWAQQNKIYDKVAFNTMEVKDNGTVVDMYADFENSRKYFKPVVRANFAGVINLETISDGQRQGIEFVNFLGTGNPGVQAWPNTVELQFRPPRVGERIMQLQLTRGEYNRLAQYMEPAQFAIMRYVQEQIAQYRLVDVIILLMENPDDYPEGEFKWRQWEIESEGRLNASNPTGIKKINLTRP